MNFQNLKKIEPAEFYLDLAFRKAKKITIKRSSKERLLQEKEKSIGKIETVKTILNTNLDAILTAFPKFEQLDPFYAELVKLTLDYHSLKKSLGSVAWATGRIDYFFRMYKDRIRKSTDIAGAKKSSMEFYGRVSSVMKQINSYLAYLEESRREMKRYPAIKTSCYTVCIFGFPNVGKSTLLAKLTSASPEINSYPFTTKSLNLGYVREPGLDIQVIDTPGTLNRHEKMNNIELQAYLALKTLANLVIYVFDPTLSYSLENQERLCEKLNEFGKPSILFMSKTDIAAKEDISLISTKHEGIITDADALMEAIKDSARKQLADSRAGSTAVSDSSTHSQ